MRIFLILSILYSSVTFADQSQTTIYANIYADSLIKKFDEELLQTESSAHLLQSDNYIKILAAREFLEHEASEITSVGHHSILLLTNTDSYADIINRIDIIAKNIKRNFQIFDADSLNDFFIKEVGDVYFPSATSSGSVSGNTFPENVWALTFDDGPRSGRTEAVVNNLITHKQRATFFVLKKQVNVYPDSLKFIMESDMELALHSYNHLNLDKQNEAVVEYEIHKAKEELEKEFETQVNLFRLPYGAGTRNQMVRQKIADDQMIHIFWNVDTLDWKDKDPEKIIARTKLQMSKTPNKSGVILFHDIHAQTVIASEKIMQYLNDEEKKVCTVGEIIDFINQEPQTCLN